MPIPPNRDAKLLLADTYEQLGYQAESGPWRAIYLMGAFELRNGVPNLPALDLYGPDTLAAMSPELVFDYWGVRVNRDKAAGKKLTVGFDFTDLKRQFTLTLANGVLNQSGRAASSADARLVLSKASFDRLQSGQTTLEKAIEAGEIKVQGRREAASELLGLRHVPVLVQHRDAVTAMPLGTVRPIRLCR